MRDFLKVGLSGTIGLIAGFYFCILIRKFDVLKIDPTVNLEINPLEIFTLLATVFLAIYVARTIAKANDLEKGTKDLLIEYLSDFKIQFGSKISILLDQSKLDSLKTNSNLKIIRKRIDTIINLASEFKFIDHNDNHSIELKNKIRDVWELFTETPQKANDETSESIRIEIERIRLEQINKIEMSVIEIEKLLFQLTMKIHQK